MTRLATNPTNTAPHRRTNAHTPQALAASLARAAVEISQRIRPLQQLQRWLDPQVYTDFQHYCQQLAVPQHRLRGISQATVQRVRTYWVHEGAVECAAVIFTRGRAVAVCIRLETFRGRWRATALDIV